MDETVERRRDASRLMGLALIGLVMALGLILGMKLLGFTALTLDTWVYALVATVALFAVLALLPRKGWHRLVPGDPRYVYTPMTGAVLLLGLYMYIAPELRQLLLVGWPVALLFLAGRGGFKEVFLLSAEMALVYLGVAFLLREGGHPVSIGLEASIAAVVIVFSTYAGLVFERLRREKVEMRELRGKLNELAMTDALTELANRRHFEQVLRAELDRVRRHGGTCSIAMLDVDFFKHYNDTVGHIAGDRLLRELAAVMRRELRLHDMVARYGGEEFAAILVHADKDEAFRIIDRLREVVEAYPFRHRDIQPTGRLTISGGIASCPADAVTYEELLQQADEALYAAKRSGRNEVRLAGTLTDSAP